MTHPKQIPDQQQNGALFSWSSLGWRHGIPAFGSHVDYDIPTWDIRRRTCPALRKNVKFSEWIVGGYGSYWQLVASYPPTPPCSGAAGQNLGVQAPNGCRRQVDSDRLDFFGLFVILFKDLSAAERSSFFMKGSENDIRQFLRGLFC